MDGTPFVAPSPDVVLQKSNTKGMVWSGWVSPVIEDGASSEEDGGP